MIDKFKPAGAEIKSDIVRDQRQLEYNPLLFGYLSKLAVGITQRIDTIVQITDEVREISRDNTVPYVSDYSVKDFLTDEVPARIPLYRHLMVEFNAYPAESHTSESYRFSLGYNDSTSFPNSANTYTIHRLGNNLLFINGTFAVNALLGLKETETFLDMEEQERMTDVRPLTAFDAAYLTEELDRISELKAAQGSY